MTLLARILLTIALGILAADQVIYLFDIGTPLLYVVAVPLLPLALFAFGALLLGFSGTGHFLRNLQQNQVSAFSRFACMLTVVGAFLYTVQQLLVAINVYIYLEGNIELIYIAIPPLIFYIGSCIIVFINCKKTSLLREDDTL